IPFVSTVNRLTSFRMSEVVVKYAGERLAEERPVQAAAVLKGASLMDLAASVLGFLLLILLAPLAANYLAKDAQTASLFVIYGLIILTNANTETATGMLQLRNRFGSIAAVNLAQSLITAALILAAFLADGGMMEVLVAYLVGKSAAGIGLTFLAFREARLVLGSGWLRTPLKEAGEWRGIGRFAFSTNLSGTVNLVVRDSETLWISLFRNPTEAGYFRIALSVINLVMLPIQPLIGTTYREITALAARLEWRRIREMLRKISALAAIWTLATGIILLVLGGRLIGLVYGADFLPAYPALMILLIGYGFANIFFWSRSLLLALGMPAYPLNASAAAGAVKTLLAFLLVPTYGYLMEAALLSAYFLVSVGVIVRKGWGEIHDRARGIHEPPLQGRHGAGS
ncbi:MAG TPA: lipopolysaccharide biosynthesis protein, partial [Anaerolineales bacterium]|nr:lipopolysaccharide biosynthesis protein [Anaerolineales bacterium]